MKNIYFFYRTAKSLNEEITETTGVDTDSGALSFMAKHQFWFIGAAIVALVVLALLQGIITSCRKKKKTPRSPPPPMASKVRN